MRRGLADVIRPLIHSPGRIVVNLKQLFNSRKRALSRNIQGLVLDLVNMLLAKSTPPGTRLHSTAPSQRFHVVKVPLLQDPRGSKSWRLSLAALHFSRFQHALALGIKLS